MKRILCFALMSLTLSGCFLRTHKADVIQGNVITESQVKSLHTGMSLQQVKNLMGSPVLINVFTPNREVYLYTYQEGYGAIKKKSVEITLSHGVVRDVQVKAYS